MLSRRFFTWVSVGVISAATIPALAAPHLARLAARRPLTTASTSKATPLASKAPIKKTAVQHKTAVLPVKKTTKLTAKTPAVKHLVTKPAAHKPLVKTAVAHKPVVKKAATAHKPLVKTTAVSHKPLVKKTIVAHKPLMKKTATPASTAKKLLH